MILAMLMAAVVALSWWRSAARRGLQRLRWDGTGWLLLTGDDAEELGVPAICVDLSHALLLRAPRADGRAVWLPLERRDAPATWHRLRVALGQSAQRSVAPAAALGAEGARP